MGLGFRILGCVVTYGIIWLFRRLYRGYKGCFVAYIEAYRGYTGLCKGSMRLYRGYMGVILVLGVWVSQSRLRDEFGFTDSGFRVQGFEISSLSPWSWALDVGFGIEGSRFWIQS